MAEQVTVDGEFIGEVDDVTQGIENSKADKDAARANLKSVANKSGGKMIWAGGVVFAAILGGFFLIDGSDPEPASASSVDAAPAVRNDAQLNGTVTDSYSQLQQAENLEGSKNAAVNGKTHLDAILPGETIKIEPAPVEQVVIAPMPQVEPLPMYVPPPPPPIVEQQQSRRTNGALDNQMGALMDSWAPSKHSTISFSQNGDAREAGIAVPNNGVVVAANNNVATNTLTKPENTLTGPVTSQKIGDQIQAVLTLGANSDEPGVVAAKIIHGKYKGALVTGSFTTGREAMTLNFNVISLPWADKSATINTIAIDPNTGSQAIAIEVERHYVERFALPFLARFITGYGDVIARAGTTQNNAALGSSVTTFPKLNGKDQVFAAVGEGATAVGDALAVNQNRRPTVIIPANTPISLMFMDDVELPAKPADFQAGNNVNE